MSFLDGSRSDFPYSRKVDEIMELYNVPLSKKAEVKEYQTLKTKAILSSDERERMNELTISLQHYIIDVEKWNFFGDVLVRMQTHYLNETVGFIDNLQKDLKKELGKLRHMGEWQPDIDYYAMNIVTSMGVGYIAQQDNTNQPPPNSFYWGKIGGKGDRGLPSLNINFKGEYKAESTYGLGDGVIYGGLWYYAKKATTGNTPPVNPNDWELHGNQTHIGDSDPFDPRINISIDTSKGALMKFYDPEVKTRRPVTAGAIMSEDGAHIHTGEDITSFINDLGIRQRLETITQESLVEAINEVNRKGLITEEDLQNLDGEFSRAVLRLSEALENKAEQSFIDKTINEFDLKSSLLGGKEVNLGSLEDRSILIYDKTSDSWKSIDYKDTYAVPSVISGIRSTEGDSSVSIEYNTPIDPEYVGTKLVYKTGGFPQGIGDGIVIGNYLSGTSIQGLKNDTEYFFRLFPYNINNVPNMSAGQTTKATPKRELTAVRVIHTDNSLDIVWGGGI